MWEKESCSLRCFNLNQCKDLTAGLMWEDFGAIVVMVLVGFGSLCCWFIWLLCSYQWMQSES